MTISKHLGLFARILLLVVVLQVVGCNDRVVHDLTEQEVNRVLSRLHQGGIQAQKAQQSDGRWAIDVAQNELMNALSLIDTSRILARRDIVNEGKRGSGLIPSREEQWFAYESKVAETLEGTLLTLQGVLDAHVHLHLPHGDPLIGKNVSGAGSGSVLLVADSSLFVSDGEIAEMVGGGAGLPAERVRVLRSIASTPKSPPVTSAAQLSDASQDSAAAIHWEGGLTHVSFLVLSGGGVFTTILGTGWLLYRRRKKRNIFALPTRGASPHSEAV